MDGTFKGGFIRKGMKEGFAGLSWDDGSKTFEEKGPADMVAKLPAIKTLVDDYKAKIISGEYKVCDAFAVDSDACVKLLAK